jgi:ABC-2 type transport system permease protein
VTEASADAGTADASTADGADAPRPGSGRSTTSATFRAGLREYARTPLLLALLVFLPAYFILTFATVIPETTGPLSVPGDGTVMVTMNDVYAVYMAPMVGALVGGIAGLFVMQAARDADARFVIAGARPVSVLLARFGLLAVVALVVGAVTTATVAVPYVPERPAGVFLAVALAALSYGLVGVLLGLVLNRLAGVYALLFGSMLDLFILQNPLADSPDYARYLPGHAPAELAVDAGFSTDLALSTAGEGGAYVLALGVLVTLALYRTMRLA